MTSLSLYPANSLEDASLPYEVIKRVKGREYRYRVERYRDPGTGKSKAKWTYLGRAGGGEPRKRSRSESTRDRLVDALSELIESRPWGEITIDSIASRAGVAHGTVYRHFADRRDVLRAAIARRREELERERPRFDGPLRPLAQERERLRAWVLSVIALPLERPGLVRAYFALTEEDEADAAQRRERRLASQAALAAYLERLAQASLIAAPDSAMELSSALFTALEGFYRSLLAPGIARSDASRGLVELFDRAVFAARR